MELGRISVLEEEKQTIVGFFFSGLILLLFSVKAKSVIIMG